MLTDSWHRVYNFINLLEAWASERGDGLGLEVTHGRIST